MTKQSIKQYSTMNKINTFKNLYEILISSDSKSFDKLLAIRPKGKDIQESLLRLFAKLDCIAELNDFKVCTGNFNLGTYKPMISYYDAFYLGNNLISIKDSGDASDLTLINAKHTVSDKPTVIAFTSKNNEGDLHLGNLDIDKISYYHSGYYNLRLGICIPNKNKLQEAIRRSRSSTRTTKFMNDITNAIILDHDDLRNAFIIFKELYADITFNDLINRALERVKIIYRPHQLYAIDKSANWIRKSEEQQKQINILWGHIARSGKSFMMNGLIHNLHDGSDENYLVITTAPNETITQYIQIMASLRVKGFNIITDKTQLGKKLKGKNLIILSKQLLTNENNKSISISNLRLIMLDEAHNGGTTDLSKTLLKKYSKCSKIFITATYGKISEEFHVDKTIKWDLEDIALFKEGQYDKIEQKYQDFTKAIYKHEELYGDDIDDISDYKKYPKLNVIGLDLSNQRRIEINEDDWTWSLNTLFEINKTGKFKFGNSVESIFRYIFQNVLEKIENHNEEIGQRKIMNKERPSVIMCFLPKQNINNISQLLEKIINHIDKSLEVCICNTTHSDTDVKTNIQNSLTKAANEKKKSVIVLTGTQGHLGVTIDQCDLVLLMNTSTSMDFIYQAMFRCMTESEGKQNGYVVDFDIDRSIQIVCEYGKYISDKIHTNRHAIEKILSQGIINLMFSEEFEFYDKQKMLDNVMSQYHRVISPDIDHYLNKLLNYDIRLTKEQLERISGFFINVTKGAKKEKVVVHDDNTENGTIKIEQKKTESSKKEATDANHEDKRNYMNTIKHLLPILCILTIGEHNNLDYVSMMKHVKTNSEMYNILQEQFKIWWGKEMDDQHFDSLSEVFQELDLHEVSDLQDIISVIKNLFVQSKNNRNELSKLIDKYLIPAAKEKTMNAEVSTPYFLRQEMLDTFSPDFWKQPKKVFEPCCGKGGFVIDIVSRFENAGMPYKQIVEECIYFADINPLNIFITKLLLDPKNEFNLNYYLGNTLEMEFDFKFDAVIGNPPYNSSGTGKGGASLWDKFVIASLTSWIVKSGFLCFVHPSGWRKPENSRSKTMGLFKLMTSEHTMLNLVIRGLKEGKKAFNCGTRYDYYLIQGISNTNNTTMINDELFNDIVIDLSKWNWLPNYNIDDLENILASSEEERLTVISNSSYHSDRDYVSETKSDVFKYPLINSTPLAGVRYCYSSINDKGHFGISKVIFGESGINSVVIDLEGKYGMTQGAIALPVVDAVEARLLETALLSKKLKSIIKSCLWGNFRIEYKLFALFKKDFYRYLH